LNQINDGSSRADVGWSDRVPIP